MWIESHQELANHPKLKRLARNLSVPKQSAIGYLHMLWWWALDYAPKGQIIPPYDKNDIADAVEWDDSPEVIVDAFVNAGFLDQKNDTTIIHDWMEYAGKLIDKRENDRIRKAQKRKTEREKALGGK